MAVAAQPGSAQTEDWRENQRENSPAAATQHRDRMIHDRLSGRSNLAASRRKRPHNDAPLLTRPYLVARELDGPSSALRVVPGGAVFHVDDEGHAQRVNRLHHGFDPG